MGCRAHLRWARNDEILVENKLMTLEKYIEERFGQEIHQRGLEEGKIEGKVESKVEIAQNMLSMGMDLNIISSATGLSTQEIKGLYS